MDGNYANQLDIIVINESMKLPDSKDLLSDQSSKVNKKSIKAIVYKIINWTTISYKSCKFDISYVKTSTADDAGTEEDANWVIRL
jgi:hypothetical protein